VNHRIQRGKILYWGTSVFSPVDLEAMYRFAQQHGLCGPTMEQTNHSMMNRRRVDGELRPLFERWGLGTTIYSPLAQGLLTGKYNDAVPGDARLQPEKNPGHSRLLSEENVEKVRKLTAIAGDLGISMAQLALAWCLKNPNVSTAIIGATKAHQVQDNVQAGEAVHKLDDGVMRQIETILDNQPA